MASLSSRPIYVHGGLTSGTLPDVRIFLDVWTKARGNRFAPRWEDVDMLDFPARLIPLIYVVDVEYEPLRFRYRFIGTKVCDFEGQDYTGQYVSDLQPTAVGEAAQKAFERFVNRPTPEFFAMLVDENNRQRHVFSVYGGIRVPLSSDDKTVTQIMGLAQFEQDHKLLRNYYWEMVKRR